MRAYPRTSRLPESAFSITRLEGRRWRLRSGAHEKICYLGVDILTENLWENSSRSSKKRTLHRVRVRQLRSAGRRLRCSIWMEPFTQSAIPVLIAVVPYLRAR